MRILFDLASAQPQGKMKINGGGESSFIFFKNIFAARGINDIVDVALNSKLDDNHLIIKFCEENNVNIYKYDSLNAFSEMVNKTYDTLVLPVCYFSYCDLNISDNVRIISVIHDLCDLFTYTRPTVKYGRYPRLDKIEFLGHFINRLISKNRIREIIEKNNRVIKINKNQELITVTFYSKSTIIKYLDVSDEEKIPVVYTPEVHPDVKLTSDKEENVLNKYSLSHKKYFMMMAGCRWAKNNAFAIVTLDKMFSQDKYKHVLQDFKVIIIGTDEKYKKYFFKHVRNRERFLIEDYVDVETVDSLYKHAHALVFPSIVEGFGLPPIEALKYETVPLCSTAMSIPEVCGDAAIYFDPFDEKSLELAILRSFDDLLMYSLRQNGKMRLKKLTDYRNTGMQKFIDIVYNNN